MIHKYLVVGKRIFFSSTKYDEPQLKAISIELHLPIETYWEILKLLDDADYLSAMKEPNVDLQGVYRKVFKSLLPFAKGDSDRSLLMGKLGKSA
jgi:hypothetical protein